MNEMMKVNQYQGFQRRNVPTNVTLLSGGAARIWQAA